MRRMHQWVENDDLPAGYIGEQYSNGEGTLAADDMLTAKEIAVYEVKSG